MDYQASLDALNTTLEDTDDVTFTPERKARALQKAWNDSYVVDTVTDNSLTFATGTRNYVKPGGFSVVSEIGISPSNNLASDFVTWIDTNLWEIQGSNIVFKNNANSIIPSGYTLYIKGRKKLDWNTDTLDDTDLQEYVVALAAVNTLSALGYSKANLFLKNDTSMSEIIALRREMMQEVKELRAKLATQFESA